MDKPFKGIRIIDMSSHGACPGCTKILSDWGAEVIKIESPKGDAARSSGKTFGAPCEGRFNPHFDMLNTGKKSIALNLKTAEGLEILENLLKSAHVFISNFRMRSLQKMNLDYEAVRKRYPSMVWAHLSGFGEYGPDAGNAGFDTVAYYARTGAMIDFAEKDTVPINAPFGAGDMAAGASFAGGIAAALYKQKCTGEGSKVTISLYGQGLWAYGLVLQGVRNGTVYPKSRRETRVPLNNAYKCGDGEWIYICVMQYERYFPSLCQVIGRPDLIENEDYNTLESAEVHNRKLIEILEQAFSTKSREEWCHLLQEADIAHSRINHLEDVFQDPQAIENHCFYERDYGNGNKGVIFMPPVTIGEYDTPPACGAPDLGEDAEEVLRSIGYNKEEIMTFYDKNVVVKPNNGETPGGC